MKLPWKFSRNSANPGICYVQTLHIASLISILLLTINMFMIANTNSLSLAWVILRWHSKHKMIVAEATFNITTLSIYLINRTSNDIKQRCHCFVLTLLLYVWVVYKQTTCSIWFKGSEFHWHHDHNLGHLIRQNLCTSYPGVESGIMFWYSWVEFGGLYIDPTRSAFWYMDLTFTQHTSASICAIKVSLCPVSLSFL